MKRICAMFLVLVLTLCGCTTTVIAADNSTDATNAEEQVLSIKSASLRLDEDIDVIYTVLVPDGCTNPYMVINGTTISASEAAGNYRRFVYTGLTPQRMTDNISATLYATVDGQTESVSVANYSVKQYCANLLDAYPNDTELVTLLSDLLTYGAAAQTYANYNTNNLATTGLTLSPSTFAALSGKAVTFTGAADPNTYWTEATLALGNTVEMRLYFATDAQIKIAVTINNKTVTYDSGFVSCGNGKYYLDVPGIDATEFDTTVSAAFYDNGVQVGNTLNYCVNAYICGTQNTENTTLRALVRALYNYGASASAYRSALAAEGPNDPGTAERIMKMKINNTEVNVQWEENESVAALMELVQETPLTIGLSPYGGFEQFGPIGQSLPRNDVQTVTESGDIVLYSGNQIVVFYGSNTWAYTRLGHIMDKTPSEMAELLGNGAVTITISMEGAK